jgi:hypothetical protein
MLDLLAALFRVVRPFAVVVAAGVLAVMAARAVADWRNDRNWRPPSGGCPL